jgi:ATP-dependent Clp protease ATP-binding subunit ClpB
LSLKITERARARLAEEGFDPAYGARPLKRVIQQRLANPLATALLERKIQEGEVVAIDWTGGEFTFHPAKT